MHVIYLCKNINYAVARSPIIRAVLAYFKSTCLEIEYPDHLDDFLIFLLVLSFGSMIEHFSFSYPFDSSDIKDSS